MTLNIKHKPIMLKEVLNYFNMLDLSKDILAIDCTLGQGGHSYEIFNALNSGTLISIDKDEKSLNWVKNFYKLGGNIHIQGSKRWVLLHDDFANLDHIINDFGDKFDFLLADLGLSNYQLRRNMGLAYSNDKQILDMRFNQNESVKTAYEYLNTLNSSELKEIFIKFGQINNKLAVKISEKILSYRKVKPFYKVGDINKVLNLFGQGVKVKVFQALRTFVNQEHSKLESLLYFIKKRQKDSGISLIITFNPLEEEIVNQGFGAHLVIEPNIFEIIQNVQSRTAKLHIYKV